jgi:hypothetical protein
MIARRLAASSFSYPAWLACLKLRLAVWILAAFAVSGLVL